MVAFPRWVVLVVVVVATPAWLLGGVATSGSPSAPSASLEPLLPQRGTEASGAPRASPPPSLALAALAPAAVSTSPGGLPETIDAFEGSVGPGYPWVQSVQPETVATGPWGSVYVGSYFPGALDVLNASTGDLEGEVHVGLQPESIVTDLATQEIFVANEASDNISVVDALTQSVLSNISIGDEPAALALDPTSGVLFEVGLDSADVDEIDPATRTVIATLPVPFGGEALAFDTHRQLLYVAELDEPMLLVYNVTHGTLVASLSLSGQAASLALGPAGDTLYAALSGNRGVEAINTSVLSTQFLSAVGSESSVAYDASIGEVVALGPYTGNVSFLNATTGAVMNEVAVLPSQLGGLAVDASTDRIFAADLFFDQVDVLNATTGSFVKSVRVGQEPDEVAADPSTGQLFVANADSQNISILNADSGGSFRNVSGGLYPQGIAFDPANQEVFLSNEFSNNLTVLDAETDQLVGSIPVGPYPTGLAYDPVDGDLYVGHVFADNVSVVNAASHLVVGAVRTGEGGWGVAVDTANGRVYVGNSDNNSVTVIAPSTQVVLATVAAGDYPESLTFDPVSGSVLVGSADEPGVTVLDGATGAGLGTIWLPMPVAGGLAYDPANGLCYASTYDGGTSFGSGELLAFNASTGQIAGDLSLPGVGDGLAYDPGNQWLYVPQPEVGLISAISPGPQVGELDEAVGAPETVDTGVDEPLTLTASSECFDAECTDVEYTWTPANDDGTLSAHGGDSVVFTAQYEGTEVVYLNATLGGITLEAPPITITITGGSGSLESVDIFPDSSELALDQTEALSAEPVCTDGTCASGILYQWSLSNSDLQFDGPSTGSVVDVEGVSQGDSGASVVASLDGSFADSSVASITVEGSAAGFTVSLDPSEVSLSPGGTQEFTAYPECDGGECPYEVSYSWSLNNSLATLSSLDENPIQVTGGTSSGESELTVLAEYEGAYASAHALVFISTGTTTRGYGGNSTSLATLAVEVSMISVLFVVLIAWVLLLRREGGGRGGPGAAPPQAFR